MCRSLSLAVFLFPRYEDTPTGNDDDVILLTASSSSLLCTFKVMQAEETSKKRVGVFSRQMCLCVSALIGFLIRASCSQFLLGAAGKALQPAASEQQHSLKGR